MREESTLSQGCVAFAVAVVADVGLLFAELR